MLSNCQHALGSVDNSDAHVPPACVRGIQLDLHQYNKSFGYEKSLDPADKPRNVGLLEINCQQTLVIPAPAGIYFHLGTEHSKNRSSPTRG